MGLRIQITDCPQELFDIIKKRQIEHMAKCKTCKYGLGAAAIAYIFELQKAIKEHDALVGVKSFTTPELITKPSPVKKSKPVFKYKVQPE